MFNKKYARGNHCKRNQGMNKLEAEYQQHLELRRTAGEILWYAYEKIKLKLADNTFYTPDFVVMAADDVLEFHEVKGFWEDDARVKIKVANEQFPFRFLAIKKASKKDGGGWVYEIF
jgi:hypothetical protein